MSNPLRKILNNCANFRLLSSDCILCGATAEKWNLCGGCFSDLPRLPKDRCRICANPGAEICGVCIAHPPAYSSTLALFSYDFPVDALVRALKYRENLAVASTFASLLTEASAAAIRPDLLIPVPMHPLRLAERGFNQAREIARLASRRTGIPLGHAEKVRDTPSQTSLPWEERRRNVKGAFSCEMDLESKHVAIVDDVLTTGATLDELARVLLARHASKVSAWVIARAVKSV